MNNVLYLFVNKQHEMSGGKIGAQVAQAVFGTMLASSKDSDGVYTDKWARWWHNAGMHHAVYVMEARDDAHIREIERYLNDRGFKTYMMIDEGMTEVPPITPTVLGVEIVDKDSEHVTATFSVFKLYRDKPKTVINAKRKWWF